MALLGSRPAKIKKSRSDTGLDGSVQASAAVHPIEPRVMLSSRPRFAVRGYQVVVCVLLVILTHLQIAEFIAAYRLGPMTRWVYALCSFGLTHALSLLVVGTWRHVRKAQATRRVLMIETLLDGIGVIAWVGTTVGSGFEGRGCTTGQSGCDHWRMVIVGLSLCSLGWLFSWGLSCGAIYRCVFNRDAQAPPSPHALREPAGPRPPPPRPPMLHRDDSQTSLGSTASSGRLGSQPSQGSQYLGDLPAGAHTRSHHALLSPQASTHSLRSGQEVGSGYGDAAPGGPAVPPRPPLFASQPQLQFPVPPRHPSSASHEMISGR
ncbi:hypothetical protein CXG81DRAFT_24030 [Caulochytrium protostelioides]|uniref:Uncharacterized protein n=1 Tax=Caulochytrium protostelioides TaxID=1555241 RepID=A0A4P9XD51_9FUNG|nr:hypothetical protein CXG81DRAFT_24030 [Caulochytrium protostelioides]|eukprot:RKP03375.1 hypothetical protein CXG81DRAFT_24030 [Caulochytrium protostelioides]